MATSGSLNTNSYDGRYYQVSWTATQDISKNQSTVKWTLKAAGGSAGWYAERTLKVVLAGTTVYSKTSRVERDAGTIASGTKVISHNSSGDASFSISIQAAVYTSSVNCTGSKSFDLDNIPRKSTLSVGNGTLNTALTLTVTRKSTSFTHTIVAKCGGSSSTICTKSKTESISFTPPLSWASENTTGTSLSVRYTITTYNGDSSVGSNSYDKSLSIPSSVKPSCSIAVTDAAGYESTYGGFIKGMSKFSVIVTGTQSYGSAISSYSTTANGSTYKTASFTTAALKTSGSLTIKATVTDKRGRSGSTSVTKTVLDYTKPAISSLKVNRCNADGTENGSGEYVKVTFSAKVTSLNSKNTAAYKLYYKTSSATSYTSVTLTSYANNYTVTDGTYVFRADTGSSYNVKMDVTDKFTTTTYSTSASTGYTLMHWLANGLGMAIGKVAELDNYLDIGFKTFFRKEIEVSNNMALFGTKQDGTICEAFNLINANGNTVLGWGNYESATGNLNLYGNNVNIGVADIATPGTYSPYINRGDKFTFEIYTAGFATNSGKSVYFIVPFSKPIIGSPTISAASNNGFRCRQSNLYLYGATSSTFAKPASYTAIHQYGIGVLITATFANNTNVTNNSPIGIHWSGILSFS